MILFSMRESIRRNRFLAKAPAQRWSRCFADANLLEKTCASVRPHLPLFRISPKNAPKRHIHFKSS